MATFLPPWRDSQKLISVWKHLGSFSLNSGNKICLICRYSQDRLSIRLRGCCSHCWVCSRVSSCVPLPTLTAEGLPGLSTSYCLLTGSTLHMKHLPFFLFQGKGLEIWPCAFRFFHTTSNPLQEVDLLLYHPKFLLTILLWLCQQVAAPHLFCSISTYIWCQPGFW